MLMYNHQPPGGNFILTNYQIGTSNSKVWYTNNKKTDNRLLYLQNGKHHLLYIEGMPEIVIGYRSVVLAYGQQPSC